MKTFEEKYNQLVDKEFNADDICRLLCTIVTESMKKEKTTIANIKKTFYGEGFKFNITIKAKPQEI
jgi:hypothetical protein